MTHVKPTADFAGTRDWVDYRRVNKIMAKDMGLPKPWEQPGKEEPDSLVEQVKLLWKRMNVGSKRT
jgi:hypothetical protein